MPLFFRHRARLIVSSVQPAPPRTDEEVRMALRQLPHYRVMLHNDDYTAMDLVVLALVRTVPQLTPQQATAVMLEAHLHGVAQVIVCPKETAEFYREGLEHYGLTSTIEPV
ncbi:MAG TPA: ATP-dependent Clp protease adapter ClpS [Ktedonobacterales bacterium]|jgi:ATP-dependent Clp protease adaptor protein ClpS